MFLLAYFNYISIKCGYSHLYKQTKSFLTFKNKIQNSNNIKREREEEENKVQK